MTKPIKVKDLIIGGGNRISVQSMLNVDTLNQDAVINQIDSLINEGCDVIRLAVENQESALICKKYLDYCKVPLVADIHFDHKIAILCSELGFSKIRINPSNIGGEEKLKEVINVCKKNKTVIRVGVNGGSLQKDLLNEYGVCAKSLALSALRSIKQIESWGFFDLIISIKSSDIATTIESNRILSKECDYPLHIGITESGNKENGLIKSAIGIGSLLNDGVGDTIRVSLTADPIEEVRAGKSILRALNKIEHIKIISCPTCSRCKYDLTSIVDEITDYSRGMERDLKLAIMGCAVNGPGEASSCDFGVAGCGNGKAVIFAKGKVIKTVESQEIIPILKKMIDKGVDFLL